MQSKDYRNSAAEPPRDPYEAYYRQARRRDRNEVALLVGSLFLVLLLVSAVIFFWQAESDQRVTSIIRDNVALNN